MDREFGIHRKDHFLIRLPSRDWVIVFSFPGAAWDNLNHFNGGFVMKSRQSFRYDLINTKYWNGTETFLQLITSRFSNKNSNLSPKSSKWVASKRVTPYFLLLSVCHDCFHFPFSFAQRNMLSQPVGNKRILLLFSLILLWIQTTTMLVWILHSRCPHWLLTSFCRHLWMSPLENSF